MKTVLRIADGLRLPIDWMMMTTVVYGAKGAGKTTFGAVVAEEIHRAGQRFCAIDLKGDLWGLKSSADGARPGIPVVIFGGAHADIPLEPDAGKLLGETVAQLRQSCIVDLEHLSKGKQIRFLAQFFEALYDKNREPLLVIADEAQRYAPQRPITPEASVCLGAVEDFCKLGRKHGLGVVLITQRGSGLNKEVAELGDVIVILRTPGVLDQKRVRDVLEASLPRTKIEAVMELLAGLPNGTAVVVSAHPAIKVFGTFAIRPRETYDSSATPSIGKRRRPPRRLAEPELDALREKMKDAIERQKAEDPKLLRLKIAELSKQLAVKGQTVAPPKPTPAAPKIVYRDRAIMPPGVEQRLKKLDESFRYIKGVSDAQIVRLQRVLDTIEKRVATAAQPAPSNVTITPPQPRRVVVLDAPARHRSPQPPSNGGLHLKAGERRLLQVVAQRYPLVMTRAQAGTLAGFTPSGGTFNTYLGTLKRGGLLDERDGSIEVSAAGLAYLGGDVPSAPTTTAALQDLWRSRLKRGEREILDLLIQKYPEVLDRRYIGEQTGFTPSGGTFNTYLGTLRRNGLVEEHDGGVRASPTLFLDR